MMNAMRLQFESQRLQLVARLDPSKITKSYRRKDWLNDLMDWDAATESFRLAIQPTIVSVLYANGQAAMLEVGIDPSVYDPYAPAIRDYFQNRSLKIAQDVNDETEKQIRATLSQGVQAGVSQAELRAMLEDIMGFAATKRADRIARTEVSRAQGRADIEAWDQSGLVAGKEWFTARDEHQCPYCSSLDGKVFGLRETVFDKGEALTINGQTQHYNYDDIPSPPLHPN